MTQKDIAKLKRDKKKLFPKAKKVSIYNEIDNYLFNDTPISSEGLSAKTPLRTACTYLYESFMFHPKICIHLDKHLNQKKENLLTFEPLEILELYKNIIQNCKISKYQLYRGFPDRKFSQDISKISKKLEISIKEAKAFYINRSRLNPTELESVLAKDDKATNINTSTKQDILNAKENYANQGQFKIPDLIPEVIKNELEEIPTQLSFEANVEDIAPISNPLLEDNNQEEENSKFLPYINQEIITSLSLSLFDIRVLRQENRFLYIFIDKYNNKRYYKDHFKAEFFISKKDGVINNSYIEPNSDEFIKYIVTNHLDLNNIRYLLDQEYRKEILL